MKRRNKNDMEQMRNLIEYYLLFAGNNPHKAYDNYIKEYLTNGESLPYYINGLKDFINCSKENEKIIIIKEERKEELKTMEDKKKDFVNRLKQDPTIINKALKQYKSTNNYNKIVALWMELQEEKINISNGLYIDTRELIEGTF